MAHLHCIEHGKRVVVVNQTQVTMVTRKGKTLAVATQYDVALHRNDGKRTERCPSELRIGNIKVKTDDVGAGILKILNGHRHGKPQRTSRQS